MGSDELDLAGAEEYIHTHEGFNTVVSADGDGEDDGRGNAAQEDLELRGDAAASRE
jgi:hypothetical protein